MNIASSNVNIVVSNMNKAYSNVSKCKTKCNIGPSNVPIVLIV